MRIIFLFLPMFLFSNVIVKYLNLKPFYYQNQIVNLKIKVISTEENLSFFSPSIKIEVNKTNPYINILNLTFKANNTPKKIFITPSNDVIDLDKIIKIKKLISAPKKFCGVFANNLKILHPISTLSNNKIILSFSLKCKNCNIEDFKLKEINSSLINSNLGTFLAYLPKKTKNFNFYYFNLKENTFKKVSIPIILKEEKISTQTDINPNNKHILTPLNIIFLILFVFTILLFLIYRKIFILILSPIFLVPIIMQFIPKGEIYLKKGDKLTILPTQNSTIIYIVKKPTKAIILKKINGYIKVKIKNKIGWIHEKNS